jgi:diguanylate cyclase (GGDEF)-like protein
VLKGLFPASIVLSDQHVRGPGTVEENVTTVHAMHIDTLTLMIPSAFSLVLAGILLGGTYFHTRGQVCLLWWAGALLLNAVGLSFLIAAIVASNSVASGIAAGLMSLAPPLFWGAIRRFNGRSTPIFILAAGPSFWLLSGVVAKVAGLDPEVWSPAAHFCTWPLYLAAGIGELWFSRDETLTYRWPLAGFLALHAVAYIGGVNDILRGTLQIAHPPALFSWFGVIHFETIIFAVGGTGSLFLLVRERIAHKEVMAANRDPLTGAANRRIFFNDAERLLLRCRIDGAPLCVAIFDLDHFKRINDTLGHKAGDQVLKGFADVLRTFLRPTDLFGRYGGEEFVVALPNLSIEAAHVIADRMRQAFATAFASLDGTPINMTVSAGVAVVASEEPIEMAIHAADSALYAAKNSGRNRVVRADGSRSGGSPGNSGIVRIA